MDPIDLAAMSSRLRRISAEALVLAGALAALEQVRWHSRAAELYRDQLHERVREVRVLADAALDLAGQVDSVGRQASRRWAVIVAHLRDAQRDLESLARDAGEAVGSAVDDLQERIAGAHRQLQSARAVLDRVRRARDGVRW